jgi:transposase
LAAWPSASGSLRQAKGKSEEYKLRCGTTSAELLRLADWLHGYQVTQVAMEATGVYWKPVWHILEGQFELLLANPTQVQALRARQLLQVGAGCTIAVESAWDFL